MIALKIMASRSRALTDSRNDGMEEKVLEMVRSRGLSDRVIFLSFNHGFT